MMAGSTDSSPSPPRRRSSTRPAPGAERRRSYLARAAGPGRHFFFEQLRPVRSKAAPGLRRQAPHQRRPRSTSLARASSSPGCGPAPGCPASHPHARLLRGAPPQLRSAARAGPRQGRAPAPSTAPPVPADAAINSASHQVPGGRRRPPRPPTCPASPMPNSSQQARVNSQGPEPRRQPRTSRPPGPVQPQLVHGDRHGPGSPRRSRRQGGRGRPTFAAAFSAAPAMPPGLSAAKLIVNRPTWGIVA